MLKYFCFNEASRLFFVFLGLTYYLKQFCTADLCVTDAYSLFLPYFS